MAAAVFGSTQDGETVLRIEIAGGGLSATLMNWGATLQDLRLAGHAPPLVLGFESFADYERHSPYFGATAGRFANRIGGGRFVLDGTACQLDRNQNETHHLHGGAAGIGKRIWRIAALETDRVRFEIDDPHGHMGYPGTCRMACTYRLKPDGVLSVVHEAETDRPTICSMTHHSYFNLDGGADILDHELAIAADSYLPVDDAKIPTGEVAAVAGTPFDFREPRPIRLDIDGRPFPYDHNYCLSQTRLPKRPVAHLRSARSGIAMSVATSEPGLQFYSGFMIDTPVPGLERRAYRPCAGLCLEAQVWPDAPNHAHFPNAVLRPGKRSVQATDYVFSIR